MLGGAASRNTPETFDRWFEAMLSTASPQFGGVLGMLENFGPNIGQP